MLSGWKARYSRRDRSFVARDSLQISSNSHIVQESVARFCHTLRKRYTKSVFMSKVINCYILEILIYVVVFYL